MATKRKAKRKPYEWTNRDQRRAEKEGWAIFEAHGGQEIEADQDSNRFKRNGIFHDDRAIDFVCKRAVAGSRFHTRALVIHLRDVIDIFKTAHGYDPDQPMPDGPGETAPTSGRYNHQFKIAYSVNSDDETGDNVDAWAHRAALMARASELTRMDADEIRETVQNMDNTYENECPSGQWPPKPDPSDDIETTG